MPKRVLLSKIDEWTEVRLELTIKGGKNQMGGRSVMYLGQTLAFQDTLDKEFTIRTYHGWKNFWVTEISLEDDNTT